MSVRCADDMIGSEESLREDLQCTVAPLPPLDAPGSPNSLVRASSPIQSVSHESSEKGWYLCSCSVVGLAPASCSLGKLRSTMLGLNLSIRRTPSPDSSAQTAGSRPPILRPPRPSPEAPLGSAERALTASAIWARTSRRLSVDRGRNDDDANEKRFHYGCVSQSRALTFRVS